MSSLPEDESFAEDTLLSKRVNVPLVWLLPLVALLVSAWLIFKSASEKGEIITINFPTAEGLEVGKTKIRYLDVDVGKITDISINEDLKTIRVTAQMNSSASNYLKDDTRFWVVKPQVGLSGVSGLNTLLSGAYIQLKPGEGKSKSHFEGLKIPPVMQSHEDGRQFILETNDLGSMRPGTAINFHGIPVGEVLSHRLADDANSIQLTIFIRSPYDKFVRKNTRFWIDSGIDLSASADGFKVRTGPLASLLSGGIAFIASSRDTINDLTPEHGKFKLYDTFDESNQIDYNNTLKYVMHFKGSVRGLAVGAPVQLRGIPIGRVVDINLELNKKTAEISVPVIVELEPDRITMNDDTVVSNEALLSQLIKKGLRGQLQMGSLVTGQLLIDLDFHPESKIIVSENHHATYPEFPTTASSFEEFSHSAQIILDKLAKLPLDKLTNEMNNTLSSLQDTSKAATGFLHSANGTMVTASDTLSSVKVTLGHANGTIKSMQGVMSNLEPGSSGYYEFHKLMQELSLAAKSMKQLTDYLEQHPESLLQGKDKE